MTSKIFSFSTFDTATEFLSIKCTNIIDSIKQIQSIGLSVTLVTDPEILSVIITIILMYVTKY